MTEPIDVILALEDAIFDLEKIEDMWGINDMHNLVSRVLNECLRPALVVVQAEETRACLGDTLVEINRVATEAARNDPTVIPVLKALDCKVAKLTAGEFAEPVMATPEDIRESMARYAKAMEVKP